MADADLDLVLRHARKLAGAGEAAPDDACLLERVVLRRDADAFEALVRRHGPLVWRVCRRALRHADAEDAWQATWLALAARAASIRKPASLGSWLHGTAFRIARKARAAAQR